MKSYLKIYMPSFHKVQSADKVNRQGLIPIYEDQENFKVIDLLNQIHDAIVFQIPLSRSWIEHAEALLKLLNLLLTPLKWHGTEFTLPVNIEMGTNLGNMIGVRYEPEAERLARQLSDLYREYRTQKIVSPLDRYLDDSSNASEEGESSLGAL